ncbi:PTS mannose/fructose/sorbose/N-acetylgalactosamine transporter subunit IIC [Tetragenococcus muriaticus]|uniref:PTS system mannose-specific IIC component n=1 Tax=Tetragenococcus muriaticus 3MR10-3 TaxID=1302648 RepID=A0A091C9U4_9ENTE|nr:PTS sugar transporter subunit IIC [Tetragenococcus muriaticus]KFN93117.1 PTS system mannose-specific IIC component [Tetragenococcus muriaticus 3MR10-3]GMA47484.1 PTS mannose transporter subunit IIA [Tetragenococcus muriaticus]
MQTNIIQATLIGLLYYLTVANSPWFTGLTSVSVRQPIVAGTIVGIILGEPTQGLIIGATLNAFFIGFISPGGAVSSEPGIAGIIGTSLAIMTNASPDVALSLAIPFGLLGTIIWNVRMTINSFFVHWMDKVVDEGDYRKIFFIHLVPSQISTFLISAVPVFLVVYYGGDSVQWFLSVLEGKPTEILEAIGGILPALGIALTLKVIMNRKGIIPFFLAGFFIVIYADVPMLLLAVFATIIAYFYSDLKFAKQEG